MDYERTVWPRIRRVTVKGVDYYQVDGRPHYKRKSFPLLTQAKAQADKWEAARARYGTVGKFIAERDATLFAEALSILAPHKVSVVEAARHYAKHLDRERRQLASKTVRETLNAWLISYGESIRECTTRTCALLLGQFLTLVCCIAE